MRGVFSDQGRLFSYISPEARVPANHGSVSRFFRKLLGPCPAQDFSTASNQPFERTVKG